MRRRTKFERAGVSFFRIRETAIFLAIALAAPAAWACPVCYGAPGDPMTKGVSNGVWVLLGLVGFVQIGFVALFVSFWRRAREQKRFREQFHVVTTRESPFNGGPQR